MKIAIIIIGLIFFIGPLFLLPHSLREMEVEKKGKLVTMKIVEIPSSCLGTKVKWFMKVEYLGKMRPIQIIGNYCEIHSIGDLVEIRYLEGSEIILLPNYSSNRELISTLVLIIFGLITMIYGLKFK